MSWSISHSDKAAEVDKHVREANQDVPDVVRECISTLLKNVDSERVVSLTTYGHHVATETGEGEDKVSESKIASCVIQIT